MTGRERNPQSGLDGGQKQLGLSHIPKMLLEHRWLGSVVNTTQLDTGRG